MIKTHHSNFDLMFAGSDITSIFDPLSKGQTSKNILPDHAGEDPENDPAANLYWFEVC